MKLVAVSLAPAFRFGGGEKWQLECLQELKCFFEEIIYISVSKKSNIKKETEDPEENSSRHVTED
jgi:hypothetical protein